MCVCGHVCVWACVYIYIYEYTSSHQELSKIDFPAVIVVEQLEQPLHEGRVRSGAERVHELNTHTHTHTCIEKRHRER
jgi:hypothetical protein